RPIYKATVLPFDDYLARIPSGTWYSDISQNQGTNTGDGTVPFLSSNPFMTDINVRQLRVSGVEHQSLPSDRNSQAYVLASFGVFASDDAPISTGLSTTGLFESATWKII